jgi:hypothetical protein
MKILIALAMMLFLNMYMYGTQLGMNDIATTVGSNAPTIFNMKDSPLDKINGGKGTAPTDTSSDLPSISNGISGLANVILFPFQAAITWFKSTAVGSTVISMATAVPTFINAIGIPDPYAGLLGVIWYVLILTLLVLVALGHY